jgi:hypothetical protein
MILKIVYFKVFLNEKLIHFLMVGCGQSRPEEALDDVADGQQGLRPSPRAGSCKSQQGLCS